MISVIGVSIILLIVSCQLVSVMIGRESVQCWESQVFSVILIVLRNVVLMFSGLSMVCGDSSSMVILSMLVMVENIVSQGECCWLIYQVRSIISSGWIVLIIVVSLLGK